MRLLFLHQNLPGQFRHLLSHYAQHHPGHVVGLGELSRVRDNIRNPFPGAQLAGYEMPSDALAVHPWLDSLELAVRRGQAVYRALVDLKNRGFVPDVVLAHPGWGEALFIKDVFPACRLISFCEFYYQAEGQDIGFDPMMPSSEEEKLQLRIRNMVQLQTLSSMDRGISPTQWQRQSYPLVFRDRIEVIHDGIDTNIVKPNPSARFQLPDGRWLSSSDELITFVNRNLEPCRGFVSFMRALPDLLKVRPLAQVLIVGGDEVSYGKGLANMTWRQAMLNEVGSKLDVERVHFLGKLPYTQYLCMLQISTVHVYLTYPFVLSWSMLEAMATGCVVVGSRTAPVEEVICDKDNGYLVDFFDRDHLVNTIATICDSIASQSQIKVAARQTILDHFDLKNHCLPKQIALLEQI